MGLKRNGPVLLACTTACVDVEQGSQVRKAVLGSIENIISNQRISEMDPVLSPTAKKQRCIEQDPQPQLDAGFLFSRARTVLRQPPSHTAGAPIGREQQAQLLQAAIQRFAETGSGTSIYVSGLPGTGKSHTVKKVLQQLVSSQPCAATITWVNCMSVSSAAEVYSQVAASAAGQSNFAAPLPMNDLCSNASGGCDLDDQEGSSVSAPRSSSSSKCSASLTLQQLVDRLSQQQPGSAAAQRPAAKAYRAARGKQQSLSAGSNSSPNKPTAPDSSLNSGSSNSSNRCQAMHKRGRKPAAAAAVAPSSSSNSSRHIIVLDEIDNLIKKSQAELVQLFLLPHQPTVEVLLIGIANSIDLTERMLPELKLKMVSPTLVCFPAYTTKQLSGILAACVEELPCKVFEPAALELCARSVASSTGDLRHALKACRAAVDELERQLQHKQQQQGVGAPAAVAAVPSSAGPTVTLKIMMAALSRLAGVRSSQFGAHATSSIRALPNQQQLLLYALSVLCQPHEGAAAESGCGSNSSTACAGDSPADAGSNSTKSLWNRAGSAVPLSSTATGSGSAGKKSKNRSCIDVGGDYSKQVFVLAVSLEEAYAQYRQVCKLLALPPCSRGELQHMAELLSQAALVDVSTSAAGAASRAAVTGSSSPGCGSGASCRSPAGGLSVKGKGGLGGLQKSVLGGGRGGRSGGLGQGLGQRGQQQQAQVKLSLRASVEEVAAALRHNPALRCLVDK